MVSLLYHENKWYRQQAQRLFADRQDTNIVPKLVETLNSNTGQVALEALWAVYLSGGWNDATAGLGLSHPDPFVRMWSIRYLGDQRAISTALAHTLNELAITELHPEVRSQLASSAKRLTADSALPLINKLLSNEADAEDPDIPLLIWWALESKAGENQREILKLFERTDTWEHPIVKNTVLKRLSQRWIMSEEEADKVACTALLRMAPNEPSKKLLVEGILEGLRGTNIASLPGELSDILAHAEQSLGNAPLTLALRKGNQEALKEALTIISDREQEIALRLAYTEIIGEITPDQALKVLLSLVEKDPSSAIKQNALHALQGYTNSEVGQKIALLYPGIRADSYVREAAIALFATRPEWANAFFDEIEKSRVVSPLDVPLHLAQRFTLLEDNSIYHKTERLWPAVKPVSSAEKTEQINRLKILLTAEKGEIAKGKTVYSQACGACHRLNGYGGTIGPELTGYDRKNLNYMLLHTVDPNADIREGYETYKIQTKEGRTIVGKIAKQEGGTIELVPVLGGKKTVLPEDKILTNRIQQVSTMPERLLSPLSDQELRDLFAYLMQD
jgi:putative heme-binding domain-containing protein